MLVFSLAQLLSTVVILFMWYSPQANVSVFFPGLTTHRTYKVRKQINADVHHLNELKHVFIIRLVPTLRIVLAF